MKNLKKILALVIVASIITVMGLTAFTLSAEGEAYVTIKRDKTFGDSSGTGHYFTWYLVFPADYEGNDNGGSFSGGHVSGTPNFDSGTSTKGVSYTASAANAAKLGKWVEKTDTKPAHWEKENGNEWFVLYPITGSEDGRYSVSWDKDVTPTAENVQAAAAWIIENEVFETDASDKPIKGDPATFGSDGSLKLELPSKGYYVIESRADKYGTGSGTRNVNLIAVTSDNVDIYEKNVYPSIEKEQEDDDGNSGTYVNVAVGQVITYTVKVNVPDTANGPMTVYDAPSKGLKYNGDVTASESGFTFTPYQADTDSGIGWQTSFNAKDYQGKTIVFTFTMTVTEDAFNDSEKENKAILEYGSGSTYIPTPPTVYYKIYFGGLYKFDGVTKEALSGTEFKVTVDGKDFKVKKSGSYYYPSSGSDASATVLTNASGTIIIRGIDADKVYTLVETAPLPGYNGLDKDVVLESGSEYFYLDSGTEFTLKLAADPSGTWFPVENNKGSLLPSTGGIGTTIFYVVGAVLVIGTGVVLVTRKRMGNAE